MTAPAGLLDRIGERLFPGSPSADGLITEEDIRNARRQGLLGLGAGLLAASGPSTQRTSFGQALGQSIQSAQQGYNGALDSTMSRRVAGAQAGRIATETAQAQAKTAARARILEQHPMPDQGNKEALTQWITTTLPMWTQADPQVAGQLADVLKSLQGSSAVHPPQEIRLGDKVILRDPITGQQVGEYPISPSPRDPNAPDTAAQLREQRNFAREQQLGDDFNKDTTLPRQTARKLSGAISEVPRALAGDGASQVNILYAFVSAMDPQSAVREGEIGLARAASPVWAQASALLDKYVNGDTSVLVPPALIRQMGDLMKRRYSGLRDQVDERVRYYRRRGTRWQVDPETFSGIDELPSDAPAPPPRQPGETVEQYMARTGGQ